MGDVVFVDWRKTTGRGGFAQDYDRPKGETEDKMKELKPPPRKHELKSWPEFFEPTLRGDKTFEIRWNDREYTVGDFLLLREYDPKTQTYTGRQIEARIDYLTDFAQQPGYVVMSISTTRADG